MGYFKSNRYMPISHNLKYTDLINLQQLCNSNYL